MPISQPAHREYRFPLPLGCARCYSEPPLGACPKGCSAPHQPSTGGSDRLCGAAPKLQRNQSCPHLWRLPHSFTHQEDRAQRGLHPHQPQVPGEPCRCPRADPHAGATAASQSETLCCLTFWSIFPLAQGAPCPGLAPRVTEVTRCCPKAQPMLEALFLCPGTETCHPPDSVGIAVTAFHSGTSPGCGGTHGDTLMALGKRRWVSRAELETRLARAPADPPRSAA